MNATLTVHGIHCRSCEALIKEVLAEAGVSKVNFEGNKIIIFFDEKRLGLTKIKKIIRKEGYEVK